jgi:hypothetical protein
MHLMWYTTVPIIQGFEEEMSKDPVEDWSVEITFIIATEDHHP